MQDGNGYIEGKELLALIHDIMNKGGKVQIGRASSYLLNITIIFIIIVTILKAVCTI